MATYHRSWEDVLRLAEVIFTERVVEYLPDGKADSHDDFLAVEAEFALQAAEAFAQSAEGWSDGWENGDGERPKRKRKPRRKAGVPG